MFSIMLQTGQCGVMWPLTLLYSMFLSWQYMNIHRKESINRIKIILITLIKQHINKWHHVNQRFLMSVLIHFSIACPSLHMVYNKIFYQCDFQLDYILPNIISTGHFIAYKIQYDFSRYFYLDLLYPDSPCKTNPVTIWL